MGTGTIRKFLPAHILGLVCIGFIVYGIYHLYFNLETFVEGGTASWIMMVGYISIIIFHFLVMFYLVVNKSEIKYFKQHWKGLTAGAVFSFFMIVVQKVMYDEVGREMAMEWPFPKEVYFIYAGLILNACFIIYALYSFHKAGREGKE